MTKFRHDNLVVCHKHDTADNFILELYEDSDIKQIIYQAYYNVTAIYKADSDGWYEILIDDKLNALFHIYSGYITFACLVGMELKEGWVNIPLVSKRHDGRLLQADVKQEAENKERLEIGEENQNNCIE